MAAESQEKTAKRRSGDFWKTHKNKIIKLYTVANTLPKMATSWPIAMLVMGSIHINNCPAESYIPIYLTVAGVFGIIRDMLSIGRRAKNHYIKSDKHISATPEPAEILLMLFLFAWFIAGSAWVYRLYGRWQGDDMKQAAYCERTLYWFTFAFITVPWIILSIIVVVTGYVACFVGTMVCAGGSKPIISDNVA